MIGLFRKMRKTLADDNQFLRYSRYAIGEILLVVVGILIALQVNNKNEASNRKSELEKYLISLEEENTSNLRSLNLRLETLTEDLTTTNNYLDWLNVEDITKVKDSLIISLFGDVGPVRFVSLEHGVYKDLIASNLTKDIGNEVFKERLFRLQEELDRHDDTRDELIASWEDDLKPYYLEHGTIIKMRDSVSHVKVPKTYTHLNRKAFINNKKLNNILMVRLMTDMRAEQSLRKTKTFLENLNEEIQNYVE